MKELEKLTETELMSGFFDRKIGGRYFTYEGGDLLCNSVRFPLACTLDRTSTPNANTGNSEFDKNFHVEGDAVQWLLDDSETVAALVQMPKTILFISTAQLRMFTEPKDVARCIEIMNVVMDWPKRAVERYESIAQALDGSVLVEAVDTGGYDAQFTGTHEGIPYEVTYLFQEFWIEDSYDKYVLTKISTRQDLGFVGTMWKFLSYFPPEVRIHFPRYNIPFITTRLRHDWFIPRSVREHKQAASFGKAAPKQAVGVHATRGTSSVYLSGLITDIEDLRAAGEWVSVQKQPGQASQGPYR